MKKMLLALAIVFVGIFAAGMIHSRSINAAGDEPLCNDNSVVKCGVYNQSHMNGRAKADAKAAYAHFGIPTDLSKAVQGTVKKNGTVVVNGKVVATGVKSMGRQDYTADSKALKIGHTTFYTRSVSNSLDHDLSAYVFFDGNGVFKGAIMKACGNPAWGTPKKPTYKCDSLAYKQLSRTKFEFNAKGSATEGAKLTKTEYVVTNAAGKEVYRGTKGSFETNTPGTYKVKAVLTFNVNGVTKQVTGDCIKSFTVKEEPKIQVCDKRAGKMVIIKKSEFNKKIHSENIKDCKEQVCVLETSTIKTIWKHEYNEKKHTRDLKKCNKMEVCIMADKTGEMMPIKPHEFNPKIHSTDVDDCKEVPPVVPPETPEVPEQPLPETGAAGTIGLITGVSALGAGGYHLFQRRRLNK